MAESTGLHRSILMMPPYKDPETGCLHYPADNSTAYETCRQAYFSKQQNIIIQQQKSQQQNTEPKPEVQTPIIQKATTTVPPVQTTTPFFANPIVPYTLLGLVIIDVVMWMKMKSHYKNNEKNYD